MKKTLICAVGLFMIAIISCNDDDTFEVEIPDFNFPKTVVFEDSLSNYNVFKDSPSNLIPSDDFQLLELSSILFTDYAHKQRLVKIPEGTQLKKLDDGSIDFPDGAILTKTFFYYNDERDTTLGKRIIETRLLIKENNTWNVATYIWNETQTNAALELSGKDTQVNWINSNGNNISALYHVPSENECIACHQSNSKMIPLGTKLRNLNRTVYRNGVNVNQISHLQSVEILNEFQISQISHIVNYNDESKTVSERGRAYLDLNCAHCHNPNAWETPSQQGFDFRYETQLNETGILDEQNQIIEIVSNGEMPFIGTTVLDQEGIDLIIKYIESLE